MGQMGAGVSTSWGAVLFAGAALPRLLTGSGANGRIPARAPRAAAARRPAGRSRPDSVLELREVQTKMIRLDTGETTVRAWQDADAPELAVQADDRRIWRNMRDAFPHPYGLQDARDFIAMARAKESSTFFAVLHSGRIAGGIGYTLHSDVERIGAEIGYWIGVEFWGRGVGTAALRLATGQAFDAHQELRRIYAVPYAGNAASARILEKVGYLLEGTLRQSVIKDGQVLDQWMYAILRGEWEAAGAKRG